jgi:arsenate reductase-like glutaredoxin family protein
MKVYFIYADGCDTCSKAKDSITSAFQEKGVKYDLHQYNIENPDALDIAIKFI